MEERINIGKVQTSETEIKDLLKAWILISVAFAIAMTSQSYSSFDLYSFYLGFVAASLTAGIGFLFHELAHKIVAQKYGCKAEFRSFDNMLIMAVVLSLFGVIFAAPGAVMISGKIDKKKNGKISAAGPVANIALSLIFLLPLLFGPANLLKNWFYYGFVINSLLALFNMIPFWLFDGYKILKWNKLAYGLLMAIAFLLVISKNFISH